MTTERTLDDIRQDIEATLSAGIQSKWARACLYKEAKERLPAHQDFGAFLRSLNGTRQATGRAVLNRYPEGPSLEQAAERSVMILSATYLTEEEYRTLGSSKAKSVTQRIKDLHHYKYNEWRAMLDWALATNPLAGRQRSLSRH